MSDLYVKSAKFLKIIITAQQEGTRKTIGDWIHLAQKDLLAIPSPTTYQRNYSKDYPSDSFKGEALPGLFLPGTSGWSKNKAAEIFTYKKGQSPKTIMELNEFVQESFPLQIPEYNPKAHFSHKPTFNLEMYTALNLPVQPPGREENKNFPYLLYNWESARERINMNYNICI